jgi:F-type H+-transporting ATPase subunit delta
MKTTTISRRYARALILHAREGHHDLERLAKELSLMAGTMVEGAPLRHFLENPSIPAAAKSSTVESLMTTFAVSRHAATFFRLLMQRSRLLLVPEIADEFRRLADDLEGIVRGEVVSAVEVPHKSVDAIREKISALLSKKVILTARTDQSLIGGLSVKVGSLSLDGSVKSGLAGIRKQLSERVKRSYEDQA